MKKIDHRQETTICFCKLVIWVICTCIKCKSWSFHSSKSLSHVTPGQKCRRTWDFNRVFHVVQLSSPPSLHWPQQWAKCTLWCPHRAYNPHSSWSTRYSRLGWFHGVVTLLALDVPLLYSMNIKSHLLIHSSFKSRVWVFQEQSLLQPPTLQLLNGMGPLGRRASDGGANIQLHAQLLKRPRGPSPLVASPVRICISLCVYFHFLSSWILKCWLMYSSIQSPLLLL